MKLEHTPEELAGLLGIVTLDEGRSWSLDPSSEPQIPELLELSIQISQRDLKDRRALFAAFAARALPTFLDIYSSKINEPGSRSLDVLAWWAVELLQSSSGARFVREHPARTGGIWSALLDRLSNLPLEAFALASSDEDTALLRLLIRQLAVLSASLFVRHFNNHEPVASPVVRPETSYRLQLRKGLLRELGMSGRLNSAGEDVHVQAHIAGLVQFIETERDGAYSLIYRGPLAWSYCTFHAVDGGTDGCLEGSEKPACGRCLAVRYCSREHQRADWKRHKLECFPPCW